jgi:hypothetical protein
METAQADITDHIAQSAKVLTETDIVIFTLGMTEIWESKSRSIVLGSHPGKHFKIPNDFIFRASTFHENLENLFNAISTLKNINREIKVIITVSPVHLLATFRDRLDVLSASCNSKSILRAVADEVQEIENVFYFPSYEIATIASPLDGLCTYPDNHHVSREVVDLIMETFEHACCNRSFSFGWYK